MSKSDESVGVEVGWSVKGFSAKIRSRLFSAADRSGGLRIDAAALDTERQVAIHRAITDTQLALIAASKAALSKEIESDPELARRSLAALSRAERQSENIGASFELALEDLRNRPEKEAATDDGPDELNPDFLNRWEQYAASATTEEVREKWGRILSAEVRKPSTFTARLLRILDEIDSETAGLFEKLAANRIGLSVPTLINDLGSHEMRDLEEAELITTGGLGYTIDLNPITRQDETGWFILNGGSVGVVVRADPLPFTVETGKFLTGPIHFREGKLSLSVIPLTNVGNALASILPDVQFEACERLAAEIRGDDVSGAKPVKRTEEGWIEVEDAEALGDEQPTL